MGLVALPGGSGGDSVLTGAQAVEDFEQEVADQEALAKAASGLSDGHIRQTRAVVIEFARTLTGPLWKASCAAADGFLAEHAGLGTALSTRAGKAGVLSGFYDFVIARYEGRRATGVLVEQPIDEFNRQTGADTANPYLLINRRTAPRLVPVGRNFLWKGIALRPQALREDRILSEIPAKIVADLPTTTDVREPEVRPDIRGTHDANIAAWQ